MDPIQRLARRIRSVEKLAFRAATQPQLAYSSIEDGAIQSVEDGTLKAIIGKQFDGTQAVTILNGPIPPTPSAPGAVAALEGAVLSWDGTFADGSVAPMDFTRVEVHASTDSGFTAEFAETLKATFETPRGAEVFVSLPASAHYVRLVARTASGGRSAASAVTSVTPQGLIESLPPATDGNAPASSPTPLISGGIGSLFLTWPPVTNADPVTYEVHVSTTTGFTPDSTTKVAQTSGGNYVVRTLADGVTPLSYDTPTYVRIVAKDADGAAPAGLEVPSTPIQATSDDIATNSVITDKLAANAITADKLAARIILASEIATGESGFDRVSLDASGIKAIQANGVVRADLPTDSGTPVFIKGRAELDNVNINDNMSIHGTANTMEPSSRLVMKGSTSDPTSQPSVYTSWDVANTWSYPGGSFSIGGGRGLCWDGTRYITTNAYFGTQLLAMNEDGTFNNNVGLPALSGYGDFYAEGGVTYSGGKYFVLGQAGRLSDNHVFWQVRRYAINWTTSTATLEAWSNIGTYGPDFNGSGKLPIIGVGDLTGVAICWWGGTTGGYYQHAQPVDTTTCALTAGGTDYGSVVASSDIGDMTYFAQGSFDFGAARTLIAWNGKTQVNVYNGTTLQANEVWNTVAANAGIAYNPTSQYSFRTWYYSYGAAGYLVKHALTNWTDAADFRTWYGTFTWRNSTNSYETMQSLYYSFTMQKRSKVNYSSPSIPPGGTGNDPNSVRFYIGKTGTPPPRTSMFLFASPAVGVTTANSYSVAFSGSNPPATNNFPASATSSIQSGKTDGGGPLILLNGDGSGRVGPLTWNASGAQTSGDTGWIAVSGGIGFSNGWVNYGGGQVEAAYRKFNGVVYLRGLIKNGTLAAVAFTLPAGFRPAADARFAVDSGSGHGMLYIQPTGAVSPWSGSNAGYALNCSFIAEA